MLVVGTVSFVNNCTGWAHTCSDAYSGAKEHHCISHVMHAITTSSKCSGSAQDTLSKRSQNKFEIQWHPTKPPKPIAVDLSELKGNR